MNVALRFFFSLTILSTIFSSYSAYGATILGTQGLDGIMGTSKGDNIRGFRGHDNITGLVGDDVIRTSQGNDIVNGSQGNDVGQPHGPVMCATTETTIQGCFFISISYPLFLFYLILGSISKGTDLFSGKGRTTIVSGKHSKCLSIH